MTLKHAFSKTAVPPPSSESLPLHGATSVEDKALTVSFRQIRRRVFVQSVIIAVLAGFLTLFLPVAKPIYLYYAISPEKVVVPLLALDMPNMTNRAILSWATTSITEVLTMGFGDMSVRVPKQKARFSEKGWESFLESFRQMKLKEEFSQRQLVLTTVPSDVPIIVAQGTNNKNVYQWLVQVPVIMTFATNNNVTLRRQGKVFLTITRVPREENSASIAIENWRYQ